MFLMIQRLKVALQPLFSSEKNEAVVPEKCNLSEFVSTREARGNPTG